MNKLIKATIITVAVIIALALFYRLLCIRVVNYEIAGIKIPSRYNIITGKAAPLVNYRGKAIRTTVRSRKSNKLGLSEDQVALAQFKWALFEQWANARREYKGWDKDPEIFKKANNEFRRQLKTAGNMVTVE